MTQGTKRAMSVHGREAGDGPQYPLRKFLFALHFTPPPLDDTARCCSTVAGPARGTMAPLSRAAILCPWCPGHPTTSGTPAGFCTRGGASK